MEENGFKTAAFGGFDKKSVLSYIDTLNEKMNAAEADYENRLAEYSRAQESQVAHIKRLEAQLAEQDGKLTAVAEQLEKEREVARQAQTMITDLDAQNQDLKKQLSDSERELQIQIERSRQLQFKVESLDYKSKKYDEVSGQIGDAMIEARPRLLRKRAIRCRAFIPSFPASRAMPRACANRSKKFCSY